MELFDYLMAKKGHNTGGDLFSYLLGKNAGGSGTYTTFSGTSLNISNTIKAKIKKFMLNSTELTQDGTPTPSSPVDVNVIKGENNVKVGNENLLSLPTNATVLGITSTQNSDGSFTLNGTATSAPNYKEFPLDTLVTLEAGTYYFTIINDKLSSNNNVNINLYTGNSNVFDRDFPTIGEHKITVTLTETKTIKSFRTYITTGTSYDNVNIKLMISKTSDSTFVEHQEQNYPITLDDLEYCKIGDYADQIFKNTTNSPYYDNTLLENEWYIYKQFKKYYLKDLTFQLSGRRQLSTTSVDDILKPASNGDTIPLLCSHYINRTANSTYNGNQGISISQGKAIYIFDDNYNDVENLGDYNTWVQANNPYFIAKLEAPQYIHITETDYPTLRTQLENLYNNAISYIGTTNITQTNDGLPFNISVDVKVTSANLSMSNSLNAPLNLDNTNELEEIEEPNEDYQEL